MRRHGQPKSAAEFGSYLDDTASKAVLNREIAADVDLRLQVTHDGELVSQGIQPVARAQTLRPMTSNSDCRPTSSRTGMPASARHGKTASETAPRVLGFARTRARGDFLEQPADAHSGDVARRHRNPAQDPLHHPVGAIERG